MASIDSMYHELELMVEQQNNAANDILERDVLPVLVEAAKNGESIIIEKESYPTKIFWNSLRQKNTVHLPDWVLTRLPYTRFYRKVNPFLPIISKS